MKLKYWADMAAREELAPDRVSDVEITSETPSTEVTEITAASESAAEESVAAETIAEEVVTEEAVTTEAVTAEAVTKENGTIETDTAKNDTATSKLPRPIAYFFRALCFPVTMIGISLLVILVSVFATALFAAFVIMIIGGIFAGTEAIRNMSQAPYVSLELLGMVLAVIALGLILMLASLKMFSNVLPKTAGLYKKAVRFVKRI